MARLLTPKDAHVIVGEWARMVTGQNNITVSDTSSFLSAGEVIQSVTVEKQFNTFSILMGKVNWASRKYNAVLNKMDSISTGEFTHRFMKVSHYSLDPVESGWFNTDLFINQRDGFTNGQNKDANGDPQSTKSMWEQTERPFKVFNYGGSDTYQFAVTQYEQDIKYALRSETEFIKYLENKMTEHNNDLETQREAWDRIVMCSKVAQTYAMSSVMPGSVKNLTTLFNNRFGTNYTSSELRSVYLKEFLAFMVAQIKADSDYLEERSVNYHWSVPITFRGKTHHILRHTPKSDQYMYLYSRLFRDAEALVLPEIFHDGYLKLENYQNVTYWQSNKDEASRSKIKIAPPIIDTDTSSATYGTQIKGNNVELDYVVGMLCDRDGMLTDFQIERAETTVLEARKGYRNTWLTVAKNGIIDPTENTIIYIMDDSDVTPTPSPTPTAAILNTDNITYQNGD